MRNHMEFKLTVIQIVWDLYSFQTLVMDSESQSESQNLASSGNIDKAAQILTQRRKSTEFDNNVGTI